MLHELERQLEVWTRREYACLLVGCSLFALQIRLDIKWLDWPMFFAWVGGAACCFQGARVLRRAQLDGAGQMLRAVMLCVIGVTFVL